MKALEKWKWSTQQTAKRKLTDRHWQLLMIQCTMNYELRRKDGQQTVRTEYIKTASSLYANKQRRNSQWDFWVQTQVKTTNWKTKTVSSPSANDWLPPYTLIQIILSLHYRDTQFISKHWRQQQQLSFECQIVTLKSNSNNYANNINEPLS